MSGYSFYTAEAKSHWFCSVYCLHVYIFSLDMLQQYWMKQWHLI